MAEPFLSEIRVMSFNFAPKGWAQCNGQLLPINQNQALFSLLGATYGGNGQTTFALPDLRGKAPLHRGPGFTLGQTGGEETHTVTTGEMPAHTHPLNAGSNTQGGTSIPRNNFLGGAANAYVPTGPLTPLSAQASTFAGGGQPHANLQPYLTLTFCIALQGIYPSPN